LGPNNNDDLLEDGTMKAQMPLSILCSLAMLLGAAAIGPNVKAESYPVRPVKIIVQAPAGNSLDVIGRILADQFAQLWGQQVLVINHVGGGGAIAARAAIGAPPDGYTLFMAASSIFVTMHELYRDLPFDVSRDLVPVGFVGQQPMAIAVSPSLGVSSLPELLALANRRPNGIDYAAATVGGIPHITGAWLRSVSGASLNYVPYPGVAQALNDILGGRIPMAIESLPGLQSAVAGGHLKILAFASEKRLPDFPDVPTAAESLPGFVAMGWFALVVPAGTNEAIKTKLGQDLAKVLARPELQNKFAELGTYAQPMSVSETNEFIGSQQRLWKPVLRQLDLKLQ
jgi:tripartite-type tricarboxylate transporter receptor subunit TctC